MATQEDIERWTRELSSPNAEVRCGAAMALGDAPQRGADISVAVPALVKALSDDDAEVRRAAAWTLGEAVNKTEVSLEEVKEALAKFVEKKGKKGEAVRKNAELEAARYYVGIANAASQRRTSIGMDDLMLPDKIKPPKGPNMYRARVAV